MADNFFTDMMTDMISNAKNIGAARAQQRYPWLYDPKKKTSKSGLEDVSSVAEGVESLRGMKLAARQAILNTGLKALGIGEKAAPAISAAQTIGPATEAAMTAAPAAVGAGVGGGAVGAGLGAEVAGAGAGAAAAEGAGGCASALCMIFKTADCFTCNVGRFRDEHFTDDSYVAKGYARMAEWLVPLMIRYKVVRDLVRFILSPLVVFADAYMLNKNHWKAIATMPLTSLVCGIWSIYGRLGAISK